MPMLRIPKFCINRLTKMCVDPKQDTSLSSSGAILRPLAVRVQNATAAREAAKAMRQDGKPKPSPTTNTSIYPALEPRVAVICITEIMSFLYLPSLPSEYIRSRSAEEPQQASKTNTLRYIVCEYYPAGNVLGQFTYNVLKQVPDSKAQGAASNVQGNVVALWVALGLAVLVSV